jgi:hypothetical protein
MPAIDSITGINAIIVHPDAKIADTYKRNLSLRGKNSEIFSDKKEALLFLLSTASVETVCIGGIELNRADGKHQLAGGVLQARNSLNRASR